MQGNLVRVRDRFWVVESVIPSRPLPGGTNGTGLEHHHAVRLVPFNPNRMEQRNGRVDRHGQKSPHVDIFHFTSPADDKDSIGYNHAFLLRVAEPLPRQHLNPDALLQTNTPCHTGHLHRSVADSYNRPSWPICRDTHRWSSPTFSSDACWSFDDWETPGNRRTSRN